MYRIYLAFICVFFHCAFVTEGWLEIDKHYSLELCFSIEKQPETVWRAGCLA